VRLLLKRTPAADFGDVTAKVGSGLTVVMVFKPETGTPLTAALPVSVIAVPTEVVEGSVRVIGPKAVVHPVTAGELAVEEQPADM
jgi:altronate dehydratase